jgi:hypothetical protein
MATINLGRVKGDKGDAASISLGTVSTLSAGSSATATNTGTAGAAVFNFSIPRGDKGETGNTGPANSLTIAGVTTGAAGSSASVSISGTSPSQTLTFAIPKGDQGIQGIKGDIGAQGIKGDTGLTGPQGVIGLTGETGPQGIQGVIGATGATGATGPQPSLVVADNASTTITLADSNNNTIIRCTSATAITITIPSTLAAGFSCMVIQGGAGDVTFQAGSGTTLNSFGNRVKTSGQHAPASLIRVGAGIYNLSGNLV